MLDTPFYKIVVLLLFIIGRMVVFGYALEQLRICKLITILALAKNVFFKFPGNGRSAHKMYKKPRLAPYIVIYEHEQPPT